MEKLEQAQAAFAKPCKRAPEMRKQFLLDLAKAKALANKTTPEGELKKLTHINAAWQAGSKGP